MTQYKCRTCNSKNIASIYALDKTPPFQHMLFDTVDQAKSIALARVNLLECKNCGYIYNDQFNNDLMVYDENYQNAQGCSPSFQKHLNDVADLIISNIQKDDKIVEIGCGKAVFFNMMRDKGFDIVGYDPTFEGEDQDIIKQYFDTDQAQKVKPDAIIMRHTLEHIEDPYLFLKMLSETTSPQTKIFIEVPRYEWIEDHDAFWDIFHEHCNYFTHKFFETIFSSKVTITPVFNTQYMLVQAFLGDLVAQFEDKSVKDTHQSVYLKKIKEYQLKVNQYQDNIVWGAGAKGVAFANILDPEGQKISNIIDINPKKHNRHIGLSGHLCVAPDQIDWSSFGKNDCIWIMNGNYKDEILASIPDVKCNIEVLG